MNILGFFQRLGRALQLPIAVLPVAALLLRFGQPDLLNVAFIAQAGGAIFDNLALILSLIHILEIIPAPVPRWTRTRMESSQS